MAKSKRIHTTSRASNPAKRLGAGWLAVLFATLFAFTSQSIVAGTHQHLERDSVSTTVAVASDTVAKSAPGAGDPVDSPANCPICRELAHSGSYLLPASFVFAAPLPFDGWRDVATPVGLALVQPSLGWRSRAPPLQLQA